MNLVVIAAFIAVCGAAKLDRTYLPPSAASAGGSPGSLQAPLTKISEQGLDSTNLPSGSFTNDFGGVVVEAAAPGTRSSEGISGLGGPRPSYGSSNSKVGDAAFRGSVAGFRGPSGQIEQDTSGQFDRTIGQENSQIDSHTAQVFPSIGQLSSQTGQFSNYQDENKSERPQAAKDRNSNIISLSNDVNADSYSYGFETDNGIAVGENGVDVNGIQAEGGYSYQGDDGQVYKVTYVADEKGYRPQGAHLPTPPPIPDEILKSLEQNAKAEAAGIVDDGSYDAEKYNADSDYTHHNSGNNKHNGGQSSLLEKRPVSSTFNLNNQAFGSTGAASFASNFQASNGQSSVNGNYVGASNTFGSNQNQENLPQFGISASRPNYNGQGTQVINQPGTTQFGTQTHSTFGQSSQTNQLESGVAQNVNFGQNSHSSQTGHGSSAGQAFGQAENTFSSSGHTQDILGSQSQFGSQFGQQASASAQFGNQALESGSKQNHQELNTQYSSSKPTPNQHPLNSAHSTQPESGTSFKPQGSEAFSGASLNHNQDAQDFGKPFPQVFSGENFNRPSGNFNREQAFGQSQVNGGSSSFNRFSQTSGQFAAQHEYLPPSSNGQPQSINPQASGVTSNTGISASGQEPQKGQIPNFVALNRSNPNFASATSTIFKEPQPATGLNAFVTQPKPNQFNQQTTQFTSQPYQPSFQSQAQINTNSQQSGSFATQTVTDIGTKPTTVPDTELTTPLEPNERPVSQGSQLFSQTTPSVEFSNSKLASQGQTQFGFQKNSSFGQSASQTLSPKAPTSPSQTSSQVGTASSQLAFQSSEEKRPENLNTRPQFNSNSFSQNQQHQPSQGIDSSYYYNQPPKTFGVPDPRPQASKFPSSPSYQSNEVAQSQFFKQQSFPTATKFPTSSLTPVRPTSETQSVQSQGYNGITQAAASSFPSAFPTQSSNVGMTQATPFGSLPNFNQQPSTGNQAQSAVAQASYSQQSTSGNRFQEIDSKKEPTITSLPVSRFPPSLPFGLVGTQTHSMGTKPYFNQHPTFSNQAQVNDNQKKQSFSQLLTSNLPSSQKLVSTGSQTETRFESSKSPEPSEGSSEQSTQTQQYEGTIYEYNKPAEVLPAIQTEISSEQINTSLESKPTFSQSQITQSITEQTLKPTSQISKTESKFGLLSNKASESSSSSFQFGQNAQTSQVNQGSHASESQLDVEPAKPFNVPSFPNIQVGQSAQYGDQTNKPYVTLATFAPFRQTAQLISDDPSLQQNNQAQSFKPFGSASQSVQPPFGTKIQFGSQSNQFSHTTQSLGSSQPQKTGPQPQSSFQNFQNSASSQGNGYFYPGNPNPHFGEDPKQFNSQPGRPQTGLNNQFNSAQQENSQSTGFHQQLQFNSASRPQFGAQINKNTQAIFGQRAPNSPIQAFSQPQFGPSSATSQAFATGQATASASATSGLKPFDSQDTTQFSNTPNSRDQNGQGTQVGVQSTIPFGTQISKEPIKSFGSNSQGSKPLFNSACCQSIDSTSAQSTDRPSSFSGAQSSSQTIAGNGEQFGGPRQPPKFDEQTGYHY